jgi:hypothetical protein
MNAIVPGVGLRFSSRRSTGMDPLGLPRCVMAPGRVLFRFGRFT